MFGHATIALLSANPGTQEEAAVIDSLAQTESMPPRQHTIRSLPDTEVEKAAGVEAKGLSCQIFRTLVVIAPLLMRDRNGAICAGRNKRAGLLLARNVDVACDYRGSLKLLRGATSFTGDCIV